MYKHQGCGGELVPVTKAGRRHSVLKCRKCDEEVQTAALEWAQGSESENPVEKKLRVRQRRGEGGRYEI